MRELQRGDNILYLFDRDSVTEVELESIQNSVLKRMASEWRQQYTHRFFLTVARNYQPIAGTALNTFESHDDSVLFADKAALLEYLPQLARHAAGFVWVVLTARDIQDAVRTAIEPAPTAAN
jgi:hypothetical protein